MSFDEKESLSDRLKKELDKKEPDRDTVIQILKDVKKEESGAEQTDPVLERYNKRPQKERKANTSSVWWKRGAVAAAVCLVVLASVPNVFGSESIFTMIGKWTKEIFSFGQPQEKEFVYQTDHPGLQELYDEVAELNLSRNVVPTWIPEDAVLDQLNTQNTPKGTAIFAGFTYIDNYIGIKVKEFDNNTSSEYQKGEEDAILYEKAGVKHYIVENNGEWSAAWVVDDVECAISVKDKEILHRILESIYLLEEWQ